MRHPSRPAGRGAALLTLALGLLTTWSLATLQHRAVQARMDTALQSAADDLADRMKQRLDGLVRGLQGARGLAVAVGWEHLTRERFARYGLAVHFEKDHPGIHGIGVIRRVKPEAEGRFVADAAADGWPGFAVRALAPHDGERFVIQYTEPVAANLSAIGLDVASEGRRRAAALASMRSGSAALTEPITLVQASGKAGAGFLLFLPVYPRADVPSGPAEREAASVGWIYAPLVIDEVLSGLAPNVGDYQLSVTDAQVGAPFFTLGTPHPDAKVVQADVPLGGRTWRLQLRPTAAYLAANADSTPTWIAVIGSIISTLLASLLQVRLGRIQAQRQLQLERERRNMAVEMSGDAVVITDTQRRVVDWNPAATLLFGFSAKEALGRTLQELIVPADRTEESDRLVDAADNGEATAAVPTQRLHRDGHLVEVTMMVVPLIGTAGASEGALLTYRDNSGASRAERDRAALMDTLARDVDERTAELTTALRQNIDLLRTLNAQFLVSEANPQGRIVAVNDTFCKVSGYSREELIGQDHHILNSRFHDRDFWTAMWASIASGQPWRADVCNRTKGGTLYWVNSVVAPITGADGRIERYISIRTDITQTKLQEQRRIRSEELLQRAGEVAGMGLWEHDLREKTAYWSAQTRHILEVPADHAPAIDSAEQCFTEADRARVLATQAQGCTDGQPWTLELPLRTFRGGERWVRLIGQAEFERGVPVRIVGGLEDITQRREAEAALRRSNQRFEVAADAAGFGVWEYDPHDHTLVWDERMFRLYGHRASDGLQPYTLWSQGLHPDDRAPAERALADAIDGRAPFDLRFRIVHDNGEVRHVQAAAHVERDDKGTPVRVVGVNLDVTAQAAAVQALQASNAELEQFAYVASHDLQEPLRMVVSYTELLAQRYKGQLDERADKYIHYAVDGGRRMQRLVADLLTYSRVGSQGRPLSPVSTDAVLRNVLHGLQPLVQDSAARIEVDPLPMVSGDASQLEMLFQNLIGNAIKFRGDEPPHIRISTRADGAWWHFTVSDNGIGIDMKYAERIFQMFQRLHERDKYPGSGIGLAVVKRIVERHGGHIELDSQPGQGTRFHFTLRDASHTAVAAQAAAAAA